MSSTIRTKFSKLQLKPLALAAMSMVLAANAGAAGLGDLTVQSFLGQPLRAEVELISSPNDAGPLTVKLASFEAFQKANIEFASVLHSLRFMTEQRGNRHVVRITSVQPVNEPFVDMLLEVRSANSAMVREYVFLLDPASLNPTLPEVPAQESNSAPAAAHTPTQKLQPLAAATEPTASPAPKRIPAPPAPPKKAIAATEEKVVAASTAASRPKLTLSTAKSGDEESARIAKEYAAMEQAVAEANARVKALEQKVGDLQKLLEVTNSLLAEMQKQKELQKAQSGSAPAATPATPASPASETVTEPKPAEANVTEPPKPAAPPPVAAAPKPVATPSEPESSWDSDTLLLPGAGLLIAALAAFGIRLARRRKQPKPFEESLFHNTNLPTEPGPRTRGGMATGMNTLLPTGATSDEVDAVAEADVYIAYGRDVQAEELLREALRTKPGNLAIGTKLLTIYATRKDQESFETLARDLYKVTKGAGEEWAQIAEMGIGIDPDNPLYASAKAAPAEESIDTAFTLERVQPEDGDSGELPDETLMEMPLASNDEPEAEPEPSPERDMQLASELTALFAGSPEEAPPAEEIKPEADEAVATDAAFDPNELRMGEVELPTIPVVPQPAEPVIEIGPLDFDILAADTPKAEETAEVPEIPSDALSAQKEATNMIEFDFLQPAKPEAAEELPAIPIALPVESEEDSNLISLEFLEPEDAASKKQA